jgi:hypothetical protein
MRTLALVAAILFATVSALVAGIVVARLGGTMLAAVSTGGGAFVAVLGLELPVVLTTT